MSHQTRRIAARILFLAVVLALAPIVTGVSSPGHSPYLSALSDMSVRAALADPGCNNKACQKDPRKGPTCFKATGANCQVAGGCTSTTCL